MGISSLFGSRPTGENMGASVSVSPTRSARIDTRGLTWCRTLADPEARPSRSECKRLWQLADRQMALVPAGEVPMEPASAIAVTTGREGRERTRLELVDVDSFMIDKMAVSNAEYSSFVQNGGYADLELFPEAVWPLIVQFVDKSGKPGPADWQHGRPAKDRMNHPVTGISWFEAMAYARWVGKSLPSPSQWQHAVTWHTGGDSGYGMKKYPWGDLFDVRRANVWASGRNETVAVDQYYDGCTPNGVYQLIGNVWEWVNAPFLSEHAPADSTTGLCEIRGGAFDTYFARQLTARFRTGQPRLQRACNTGFRCAIACRDIHHWPDASRSDK